MRTGYDGSLNYGVKRIEARRIGLKLFPQCSYATLNQLDGILERCKNHLHDRGILSLDNKTKGTVRLRETYVFGRNNGKSRENIRELEIRLEHDLLLLLSC